MTVQTATEHAADTAGDAIVDYALRLHAEGTDLPTAVAVATEMTIGKLRTMERDLLVRAEHLDRRGGAW